MDTRKEVELHIETEGVEGLTYRDCPACGRRNKLMIGPADEGGYWWKCLSASCETYGTTKRYSGPPPKKAISHIIYKNYRELEGFRMGVPIELADYLYDRYYLHTNTLINKLVIGTATTVSGEEEYIRAILPIRGPLMRERGYVSRFFGHVPSGIFKSLTYPFKQEPMLAWYFPPSSVSPYEYTRVIVVEDQTSAVRLSQYFPTVALLGTSMSTDKAWEIQQVASLWTEGNVTVILDNDAAGKAPDLARHFPRGSSYPLFREDIKDMAEPEFKHLVRNLP